jgi:hypothetical protein
VKFLAVFLVKALDDLLLGFLVAPEKERLHIEVELGQQIVNVLTVARGCIS